MFTNLLKATFVAGLILSPLSSAQAADSIRMLPPGDCEAYEGTGTHGVIGWDAQNPMVCIDGFRVDSNQNVFVGGNLSANGYVDVGEAADNTCSAYTEGALRYNPTKKAMQFCDGTEWTTLLSVCNVPAQAAQSASVNMLCSSGAGALMWCVAYTNVVNTYNSEIESLVKAGECAAAKDKANERNNYINKGGHP